MAYEIIHQKVSCKTECICGSKLKYSLGKGVWICIKQELTGESNRRKINEYKRFENEKMFKV